MEKIKLSRTPYELGLHITKYSQGIDLDEICRNIIDIKKEVNRSISSRCKKVKKYYGIRKCNVCPNIEKTNKYPNQINCSYNLGRKNCKKCSYATNINCDINVDISIPHGTYDIATLWCLPHEYWHSRVRSMVQQIEKVDDILSILCHRVEFENFDKKYFPFEKEIINYTLLKKDFLQKSHKELFEILNRLCSLRENRSDLRLEVFLTYTPYHFLIKTEFEKDKDSLHFPILLRESLDEIRDYETATIISVNNNQNGKKSNLIQNWLNEKNQNKNKDEKSPYRLLIKAKNMNKIEKIFETVLRFFNEKNDEFKVLDKPQYMYGYWDGFISFSSYNSKTTIGFVTNKIRKINDIERVITLPALAYRGIDDDQF